MRPRQGGERVNYTTDRDIFQKVVKEFGSLATFSLNRNPTGMATLQIEAHYDKVLEWVNGEAQAASMTPRIQEKIVDIYVNGSTVQRFPFEVEEVTFTKIPLGARAYAFISQDKRSVEIRLQNIPRVVEGLVDIVITRKAIKQPGAENMTVEHALFVVSEHLSKARAELKKHGIKLTGENTVTKEDGTTGEVILVCDKSIKALKQQFERIQAKADEITRKLAAVAELSASVPASDTLRRVKAFSSLAAEGLKLCEVKR